MYVITSRHDIVVDSYEDGEQEHTSFYEYESKHEEINNEAIAEHLSQLGFSFEADNMYKDEDRVYYSWLVNSEDVEASQWERDQWVKNKFRLYSNNATITFQQLIDVMI